MKKQEFITNLQKAITNGMSEEFVFTFEKMKLDNFPRLKEMATWYKTLNEDEKVILRSLILEVSERTLFGVLCTLDGVRAISNEEGGALKLYYVNSSGKETLLNSLEGEYLHDIFQANR